MNSSIFKTALFGVLLLLGGQVQALTINDTGVVGAIDHCDNETLITANTGCVNANDDTTLALGNYLLGLGADATDVVANANGDDLVEIYWTSSTDYNGTLTDATRVNGSLTGWTGFEYVMAKYDGQKAGFVMFNVADYLAAYGDSLPEFSYSIWGNNAEQYQLSNWTGFNATSVPEPGTAMLLGLGLISLVGMRKKFS